jgi:hypothetical protein
VEAFGCPPASRAEEAGDNGHASAGATRRDAAGGTSPEGRLARRARLDARVLLDHLRHEVQAFLHSRRRALESFAFDRFGHRVVTQTQRDVFDLLDRMGKRGDAGGIDRLHLLDEAEKIVELDKRVLSVGVGQFEPRKMRDAFYIGQSQSHAVTGKCGGLPQHGKTTLRQRVTTLEEDLEKGASGGKKCRPFPSKHPKL